ncbi:MAG: type II toxin-antitoxin system HicB family antitoxin [Rhodospirillaceae bacterium]|nr:type II toxin-antitoxin system HicB family antitoxin [Rhodospirillaceae bacterium]
MLTYPVDLLEDGDTVMASLPDLPGCRTYGETHEEALERAVDAALTLITALVKDREEIPDGSSAEGRPVARLPLQAELKVQLYRAMRAHGIGQSDLAERLNKSQKEVWRLLDLTHASKLDQIEAAFAALGYRVDTEVRAVA